MQSFKDLRTEGFYLQHVAFMIIPLSAAREGKTLQESHVGGSYWTSLETVPSAPPLQLTSPWLYPNIEKAGKVIGQADISQAQIQ